MARPPVSHCWQKCKKRPTVHLSKKFQVLANWPLAARSPWSREISLLTPVGRYQSFDISLHTPVCWHQSVDTSLLTSVCWHQSADISLIPICWVLMKSVCWLQREKHNYSDTSLKTSVWWHQSEDISLLTPAAFTVKVFHSSLLFVHSLRIFVYYRMSLFSTVKS